MKSLVQKTFQRNMGFVIRRNKKNLMYSMCFLMFCGVLAFVGMRFVNPGTAAEEDKMPHLLKQHRNELGDKDAADIPNNAIYFLETSGMPMLSPKELCAIESAALHHPHRPVVVAVNHKYLQLPTSVAKWAKIYPNVIFTQLDINKWLEGTVLLPWLSKGLLDRSLYKISHTSDILRFATMYKYGGLYMDTDVIVLRSMDDLGNAVGLQEYTRQGAVPGIMSFRKHHPIMAECLEELVLRFDPIDWGNNGPTLLSRVIRKYCGLYFFQIFTPRVCKDVTLLPTSAFYPIDYNHSERLFSMEPSISEAVLKETNNSYSLHYWNKMSSGLNIEVGTPQALGILAAKNCPMTAKYAENGIIWGFDSPAF